jgi:hypothetical protein
MDDFFGFLKSIAPTVAGFVGTPALGVATEALIKAFDGDEEKVKAILSGDAQLSSDDIARIKLAEIAAKQRSEELGVTLEQLDNENTNSARAMNTAIQGDAPTWMAKNTAYLLDWVIVGGALYLTYLLFIDRVPLENKEYALMAFGSAWTLVGTVVNFHRGSSAGSRQKDKMIGGK